MKIEHPYLKSSLLFLGFLCKALAAAPVLPFAFGEAVQVIASKLWIAIDAMFVYTLNPPRFRKEYAGDQATAGTDKPP